MTHFSIPSADGTELFARHWSVDSPKAVMALVHGFGEHSGRYAHMAAHLNANDIAVVAVDLRGHGKTPGKRGVIRNYDDFRADIAALMESATGFYPDTPLILYGHSMGGGIVLDYGLGHQDDLPIIASAPLITLTQPLAAPLRLIIKIMGVLNPNGSMKQPIDGTKISNLASEQEAYMADPLNHGTMGFRLGHAIIKTGETIAKQAATWDRPLLLLHSKADQLTGFDGSSDFAKAAKRTAFHAFESPQHEMHNDASRDEVYTRMTDFILTHTQTKIS